MKAGSVLLYNGTVLHGGGSNQTQENRIGVLLHYTLGQIVLNCVSIERLR